MAYSDDDVTSERGMFIGPAAAEAARAAFAGASGTSGNSGANPGGVPSASGQAGKHGHGSVPSGTDLHGITRTVPPVGKGWGRGVIPVDTRKFRYDVTQARASAPVPFSATKVDRMDAVEAGDKLHSLHVTLGIDREPEARILGFDNALWLEHFINGASMLQPGRGALVVDGVAFDIAKIRDMLGEDVRRFFRAFADNIAACARNILDTHDPYDAESVEKVGQIRQVALERGMQKYPHLAFDAADACVEISMEERSALIASKGMVLESTANAVDTLRPRVPPSRVG